MFRNRFSRLASPAIAALLLSLVAMQSHAQLMWEATKGDRTLTLLGTVHAAKPGDSNFSPAIEERLKKSQLVAMEIVPSAAAAEVQRFVVRSTGPSLKDMLKPATYESLGKHVGANGGNIEQLNALRPWIVISILAMEPLTKAGYRPDLGTETQLEAAAKRHGVKAIGLESVERQVGAFESLTAEEFDTMIAASLRDIKAGAALKQVDTMLKAIASADTSALEAMVQQIKGESALAASAWTKIVESRNVTIVQSLKRQLATNPELRQVMLAIGSLHFVGGSNLLELLKAEGYNIKPIK
jgi:hypothetical protein